jgi:hypothetical protein
MTRKSIAVPAVGSNYCYVGSYEVDGDCVPVFNEDGNLLATVPAGDNPERSKRRALVDRSPLVTDTAGSLLVVLVHAANIQDIHGAVPLLRALGQRFPKLRHIFADRVYRGQKAARRAHRFWQVDDRDRHPLAEYRDLQSRAETMGDRAHHCLARSQPSPRLRTSRQPSPALKPGS